MPITNEIPTLTPAEVERFYASVNTEGDCWGWEGNKNSTGYGRFKMRSRRYVAHRVMWEVYTGEKLSTSIEVDHTCHNRACCNPAHLRKVTRKQNMENHSGPLRTNTSGVRGVSWRAKSSRWVAQVSHHNRVLHVGYFINLDDAEAAVIAKRSELQTHNDADRSRPNQAAFPVKGAAA
jgi:hypothetical protein